MKNIFRTRNTESVEVLESNKVNSAVPVDAEPSDATAQIAEAVPAQTPESHPPELSSMDLKTFHVTVAEVTPPVADQAVIRHRPELTATADINGIWVRQYAIPEMEAILAEIHELEDSIREMEQRKAELEKKVSEREVLRNALLTGSGLPLKQAVQYVFSELGVSVQPSLIDQTEIVLEHTGLDYVGEVIACEGPTGLANIRQLNHWVEDFIEMNGRQPKGLLIANPFAHLPLDKRDATGCVAFPEELRLLAEERYKFCLLTTPQLFVAYCKFKEDQLNVNEFMTELFETVWVYGNHRDYVRFKVAMEVA